MDFLFLISDVTHLRGDLRAKMVIMSKHFFPCRNFQIISINFSTKDTFFLSDLILSENGLDRRRKKQALIEEQQRSEQSRRRVRRSPGSWSGSSDPGTSPLPPPHLP